MDLNDLNRYTGPPEALFEGPGAEDVKESGHVRCIQGSGAWTSNSFTETNMTNLQPLKGII